MYTFDTEMRQYAKDWWVLKGEDGVWQIVNHNAYLKYKKGVVNNRPITTITPYSVDCSRYILMMIEGSSRKFASLLSSLSEIILEKDVCEEGGTLIFHKDNIEIALKQAKMKKKTKIEMSEERKASLRERLLSLPTHPA